MNRPDPSAKPARSSVASFKVKRTRRAPSLGIERLEDRSLLALIFGNALGVGGNGATGIETTGIAIDSTGNRYITGSYSATVDFGGNGPSLTSTSNGIRDGFVAKYNNSGLLVWLKPFGGTLNDRAAGVALDVNGNAFVTGYFQGPVTFDTGHALDSGAKAAAFFWELDPNGNTKILTSAATTGSIQPQSIAVDASGANFVVGGIFNGSITLGNKVLTSTGNNDSFLTKLNVNGAGSTFTWSSQLAADPNSNALVNGVAIDVFGNVLTTGTYNGAVDFNPGPGIDKRNSNGGTYDIFVSKLASADGSEVFAYTPGGAGAQDTGYGITSDAAGNILATGAFQGTVAFVVNGLTTNLTTPASTSGYYLLTMSPTGTATVARSLNALTTGTNTGTPSIAVNPSGTIAIATTYTGPSGAAGLLPPPTSAGGSDILIETLDYQGNVLQQVSAGGTSDDSANGVTINATGKVSAIGAYQGPATFGATVLPNKYVTSLGTNIFLASLSPPVVIPGDFIGNQTTQPSVYRPSTSAWYVQGLPANNFLPLGTPGVSLPVTGDYEGIGHAQQAVFNPTDASWSYRTSIGTIASLGFFGWPGHDIPVPGDYDGIGKTELAVYRPQTAQWFVLSPGGGRLLGTFGWPGHDIPAAADYTGNGVTTMAVYRPTTAEWFVAGQLAVPFAVFGWPGHDIPVPGDYGKIGKSVPAVYRPEAAQWFFSGNPNVFTTYGWPTPFGVRGLNDIPTLARTGTLKGLPIFNPDGSISSLGKPSGGAFSASVEATPKTTVKVTITPVSARPAPSFVKSHPRRLAPGHGSKVRG